jgi:hypothetical protein
MTENAGVYVVSSLRLLLIATRVVASAIVSSSSVIIIVVDGSWLRVERSVQARCTASMAGVSLALRVFPAPVCVIVNVMHVRSVVAARDIAHIWVGLSAILGEARASGSGVRAMTRLARLLRIGIRTLWRPWPLVSIRLRPSTFLVRGRVGVSALTHVVIVRLSSAWSSCVRFAFSFNRYR